MENKRLLYLRLFLLNTIVYGLLQFIYSNVLNRGISFTETLFQSLFFGILMAVIIIETKSYKFPKKSDDP